MATTLPMSRLVSPSSDSRVSRAYRHRPVLTTPDPARAHLGTILSSSPRRSGRVTRGASETDATTQHNNEDNEKEGDDDEKALVGDRPYRLVLSFRHGRHDAHHSHLPWHPRGCNEDDDNDDNTG